MASPFVTTTESPMAIAILLDIGKDLLGKASMTKVKVYTNSSTNFSS